VGVAASLVGCALGWGWRVPLAVGEPGAGDEEDGVPAVAVAGVVPVAVGDGAVGVADADGPGD
jgi:hypothetical protein